MENQKTSTANEKLDTLLQMALSLSETERGSMTNLNAGYDAANQTWELIVKYNGDINELAIANIIVEPLLFGYAIVTLPETLIPAFAALDQVEFIEKPKLLFPQATEGIRASCIWPVQNQAPFLSGKEILIGIIDSGITYDSEAFLMPNEAVHRTTGGEMDETVDRVTRIKAIYDQSLSREFTEDEINEALKTGKRLPTVDVTGHGTAVAAIAAGSVGKYQGVAYEASLLVVKLDSSNQSSYPMTTNLLRAFDYMLKKANVLKKPIAINVSFGNTYGSHDGKSLVERFLDSGAGYGRNVICVGSGNEAAASGHTSGRLKNNYDVTQVSFFVGNYETNLSLQLWKNYEDSFAVTLISPGGERFTIPAFWEQDVTRKAQLEDTLIYVYEGGPRPYSTRQELYFQFRPLDRYIGEGIWTLEFVPERIVTGVYELYLPSQSIKSEYTRFLSPVTDMTFTIPSTAAGVVTVGAYDIRYNSYADFSGRGYVAVQQGETAGEIFAVKPDLVAPGVGIVTTNGKETVTVNGTSFATPFVTGSAALMMQWGIGMGNDPYLYGEKVKAYLIRGAKPLPGIPVPSPMTGWGKLCLADSIPQ